jgi:hypothetical protein
MKPKLLSTNAAKKTFVELAGDGLIDASKDATGILISAAD